MAWIRWRQVWVFCLPMIWSTTSCLIDLCYLAAISTSRCNTSNEAFWFMGHALVGSGSLVCSKLKRSGRFNRKQYRGCRERRESTHSGYMFSSFCCIQKWWLISIYIKSFPSYWEIVMNIQKYIYKKIVNKVFRIEKYEHLLHQRYAAHSI